MKVRGRLQGLAAFLIVLVCALSAARSADAQTPPPAAPPSAPPPPSWNLRGSFNVVRQSATYDLNQVLVNGLSIVQRGKTRYMTFGDITYTAISVSGKTQVQTDSDKIRFVASRSLTDRTYVEASSAYKRNVTQGVKYVVDQLVGVGIRFNKPGRGVFDVAGVAGALEQKKNLAAIDGTNFTYGALETLSGTRGPWQAEQTLLFLQNSKNSDDYRLQFSVSLIGRIAGPVGVNFTYQIDRENVVAIGGKPKTETISAGVTLALPWVRPR